MARRKKRFWRRLVERILPRSFLARVALAVIAIALGSVAVVNGAVAYFGQTKVSPLSPFHLPAKTHALGTYFEHRPMCFLRGGDADTLTEVRRAAARHRLDPRLLEALVDVESQGRCHRISPVGAMGPAQLVSSTARELHVHDPFDARQGIDGGARYLKAQLVRFHGNVPLAVAAYNAGPGAVHGRVPHNGETEIYVRHVIARWHELTPKRSRRDAKTKLTRRPLSARRAGRGR